MIGAVFFVIGTGLLHAQNLVTNGGFENGFTGWTNSRSGSGNASFSLESNLHYAGTNALKTVVSNPGADNWNVETRAPIFTGVGTGRSLSVTFRARAATAGTMINAAFQNGTGTYRAQSFTLSTSWAYYTWNHTTIQDSPGLKFQYRSAGTVWLDQISVVVNPTPPAGLAITPNLAMRHQIMDGIGGSIAFNLPDYEALSATQKNQIENLLYVDCGIDIVRLRTGNSDALNNELAMRAQRNGARSLLTCWSPPASLKSNNSIISGTLRIVSGKYDYAGFADWWYARLNASNWIHDFISIQNEREWVDFCREVLREPELPQDPRAASNAARVANRAWLDDKVAAAFASLASADLIDRLTAAQTAYGNVNGVHDLIAHPQLRTRRMPIGQQSVEVPALPWITEWDAAQFPPAPSIDQHGAALREEFASSAADPTAARDA